jgi:hypothetical protein
VSLQRASSAEQWTNHPSRATQLGAASRQRPAPSVRNEHAVTIQAMP